MAEMGPPSLDAMEFQLPPFIRTPAMFEEYRLYHPGGLHPTRIGDKFKSDRYEIVRKLGHGSFSTVWLARDHSKAIFVAIKICRAISPRTEKEVPMHEALRRSEDLEAIKEHVAILLDSFRHTGPHGEHPCLVFEPQGPDITSLFVGRPASEGRLTYEHAKLAIKQLIEGVHCLHSHRIVYSDLNLGNLLIAIDQSNITSVLEQRDSDPEASTPTEWDDEMQHIPPAPDYLLQDRPLAELADSSSFLKLKISDLGAAFAFEEPPEEPIVPTALRAPEVVLGSKFSCKIDIWSIGCLVYEFLTGRPLFDVAPWLSQEDLNDDHLVQMVQTLGRMPESTLAQWSRSEKHLDSNMESIRTATEEEGHEQVPELSLAQRFMQHKPSQMDTTEARSVLSLLKEMLQFDPSARPTSAELINNPWIRSIDE